jgi:ABC-type transport system involved in multi-copper enzyme maturation permease subunit
MTMETPSPARPRRTAVPQANPAPAPAAPVRAAPPAPAPARVPAPIRAQAGSWAKSFSLKPGPGNPWPLFATSLRGVLRSRKTIFLFLFLLLPVYITWIIQGAAGLDAYDYETYWGGAPAGASAGLLWFQDASFGILFPFLVPLIVAVFAASAIGEEVEGKTLPYIFMRPVFRNWILLAKAGGTFVGVFVVACAGLVVFWFASVGLTQNPFDDIGQLFGHIWILALSILAGGSLFLLLGVLWRRSIILIVIYLFVWEFFLSQAPALFFKRFSLVNYERPILRAVTGRTASLDDIAIGFVSPLVAHFVLLGLALGGLLAALYVVSNKDYNV